MTVPRPTGLVAAALAALVALLLGAAPALAHTELEKSNPAEGARLDKAPATISLTFGEAVTLPPQPFRITGPGGAAWTVGKATISGATVTAPVTATGPAGAYALNWSVIADDGDAVKGAVHFTLTASAGPVATTAAAPTSAAASTSGPSSATAVAPAAADSSEPASGVPGWVWVVVGVVVVAIAAAVVIARSRRTAGRG